MPSSFQAFCRRSATLPALGAFLALLFLCGCAQLPQNVERPISTAITSPASGTALADLVQQRRQADKARYESGFMLMGGPQAAYGSRLALIEGAQKTLDLQYYAIHADASTGRLMRGLRGAAERGVRVRVLLDDFHTTGRDAAVLGLAFIPNIEMRLFNPIAGSRDSRISRFLNSIDDASRIQQRMHNKLFIADNVLAVTGGRNLGDAYFGNAANANFIDVDVLAAGPIVQDLSRSFDSYWNNERAYPVQSLITREELQAMRDRARKADQELAEESARAQDANGNPKPPDGEPRPNAPPTAAQRARAWDEKPLDLRTATFVWAPAVMLADKPGKIPADSDPTNAKAPGLVVSRPDDKAGTSRGAASLEAASDRAANGDTVVEGLLQLIGQARTDLVIISPYFVPGKDMLRAFSEARGRGVRIRVLTNSLASNDVLPAHSGYAKTRKPLLENGMELYELRPDTDAFRPGWSLLSKGSRAALHTKAMVFDREAVFIGSFNLEPRSAWINTEAGLYIESPELAERLVAYMATGVVPANSYHVLLDANGEVVWETVTDGQTVRYQDEPDTDFRRRFVADLWKVLPIESQL